MPTMFQIGCSLKFKHQKKDKTLFRIKIKKTYIEYLNLLPTKKNTLNTECIEKGERQGVSNCCSCHIDCFFLGVETCMPQKG